MVATSYVLVSVAMGRAREVYHALEKLPAIERLDAVTGPYDLVATVQGLDFNDVARTVVDRIQRVDGVTATITCNVVNFEV